MQTTRVETIESSVVGKHVEFEVRDMVVGYGQVRAMGGVAIGATVVKFDLSVADIGPGFNEGASGNRITGEGLSTAIDLLGKRRVRATIVTASGLGGSLIEVAFCAQNQYVK